MPSSDDDEDKTDAEVKAPAAAAGHMTHPCGMICLLVCSSTLQSISVTVSVIIIYNALPAGRPIGLLVGSAQNTTLAHNSQRLYAPCDVINKTESSIMRCHCTDIALVYLAV